MRPSEPLEPGVAAALAAIDATLDGEPVAPEHAELAELALILRDERPRAPEPFTARLDARVQARFAAAGPPPRIRHRSWRPAVSWVWASAAAVAAVVAALVVVGLSAGGGSGGPSTQTFRSTSAASTAASAAGSGSPRAASGAASNRSGSASTGAGSTGAGSTGAGSRGAGSRGAGQTAPGPAPAPSTTGNRQVVQSAQLALSTAPRNIDGVAQQVFDVVGAAKGVVSSSHVTSTGDAASSADFQLSIPGPALAQTLTQLSQLRGAHVISRSDSSSDITGQVGGAGRRLAADRALQRSLLRQLAAAVTTEAVTALRAQLRNADAAIGRDQAALAGLHRQVQYSSVAVTISAAVAPGTRPPRHGGGLSFGRAAHDAGRVLVVAAGVALIALAVLVPVGLLAAVALWVGLAARHRRREAALGPR